MSENDILLRAREIMRMRFQFGTKITHGADVAEYLQHEIGNEEREVFGVLYLTQKHEVIEYRTLFQGSLTEVMVHPREVFRPAIELNAAAIIISHNHPSGGTRPSTQDKELTKRLLEAGSILGIKVLDHVIVSGKEYTSFCDKGLI